MKKVLVTETVHPAGLKMLEDAGYEVIKSQIKDLRDGETLTREMADVDAALIRIAEVPREAIEGAKNLKIIANHGVGIDNYPLDALKEKGIRLTTAPGANSRSVAEFVMGLMLAVTLQIKQSADNYIKEGWAARSTTPMGYSLEGKTLSIIGYGRIGRIIGDMAMNGFGMKVVVYDPYVPRNDERVTYVDDVDDALKAGDYVTLHLALTDDTRHMINDHAFQIMKKTAILINCARGPIVDEEALVRALQNDEIWGAGIDATEVEPLDPESYLFKHPRTIVTPHFAIKTNETEEAVCTICAKNIIDFFEGNELFGEIKL
ncbi:MAG: hydroxyacid dehydrogenase [Peptoniphilaceae bacterium]|nr:hydroxyacid dehydrogenase [Peptoniphilaceae bacterium]MDY6085296.1 hydroxyacid dehydrogenase [Peptoniphilaceae bacterium]